LPRILSNLQRKAIVGISIGYCTMRKSVKMEFASYANPDCNGSQSTEPPHSLTNVLQGSDASFLPEQSKKYPTPELTQTLECVRRPPPQD